MSNRAYASVWFRNSAESSLLERFGQFLVTVPFSRSRPGFEELIVRAVDPSETPIFERDLRGFTADADKVLELAQEYAHADCCYETESHWDLWIYDQEVGAWQLGPQPLNILCYGPEYDEGAREENGDIQVDIGFEHLFTGHARLLGLGNDTVTSPAHPAEARFMSRMSEPGHLGAYHEKTRDNIRRLYDWMQRAEARGIVERCRLWSEGEENFEARLEEILAVR